MIRFVIPYSSSSLTENISAVVPTDAGTFLHELDLAIFSWTPRIGLKSCREKLWSLLIEHLYLKAFWKMQKSLNQTHGLATKIHLNRFNYISLSVRDKQQHNKNNFSSRTTKEAGESTG